MSPQAVAESTRADLRNAYAKAQGPFTVSDEQGDFIVMRASDYDGEPPLTEGGVSMVLSIPRGNLGMPRRARRGGRSPIWS